MAPTAAAARHRRLLAAVMAGQGLHRVRHLLDVRDPGGRRGGAGAAWPTRWRATTCCRSPGSCAGSTRAPRHRSSRCWCLPWSTLASPVLRLPAGQRVRHAGGRHRDHPVHHLLPDHRGLRATSGGRWTRYPACFSLGRWAWPVIIFVLIYSALIIFVLSVPSPFHACRQGASAMAPGSRCSGTSARWSGGSGAAAPVSSRSRSSWTRSSTRRERVGWPRRGWIGPRPAGPGGAVGPGAVRARRDRTWAIRPGSGAPQQAASQAGDVPLLKSGGVCLVGFLTKSAGSWRSRS